MIEFIVQHSNRNLRKNVDEEINVKEKGIINQYFRVSKESSFFSFNKRGQSLVGRFLSKTNRFLLLVAVFYFAIVHMMRLTSTISYNSYWLNVIAVSFNLMLFAFMIMHEFNRNKSTVSNSCGHEHSDG